MFLMKFLPKGLCILKNSIHFKSLTFDTTIPELFIFVLLESRGHTCFTAAQKIKVNKDMSLSLYLFQQCDLILLSILVGRAELDRELEVGDHIANLKLHQ